MSIRWIWAAPACVLAAIPAWAQMTSYTIDLQPGYNPIANHFDRDGNRLAVIIPDLPGEGTLWRWNPAQQRYMRADYIPGFGWLPDEPEMDFLHPGEGAFLRVNKSAVLTFFGTPGQFALPRQAVLGYNFVSPHAPRIMSFGELFGSLPQPGDRVYLFDNPFTIDTAPFALDQFASSIHMFTPQGWDAAPAFKPRRCAFVFLSDAPRILAHPKSQNTNAGGTLRLEVSALGAGPLRYQWHLNEDDIPGETDQFLLLDNVQFWQMGHYSVSVSNPLGTATSRPASVRVSSPPVILEPPEDVRAIPGQRVTLRVKAAGTPVLRYLWFRNDTHLTNQTLPIIEITAADSTAGGYHVRVTNNLGVAFSQPVTIEVNDPPTITEQPAPQIARRGENATFTVVAKGTPPLMYHWRHNGHRIFSSPNPTLSVSNAQPRDAGDYDVVVVNVAGAAHSEVAQLTLNLLDVPHIFLSDSFAESVEYPMPAFTGRGDNLGASNELEEAHCQRAGGSSVWLRWMTPGPGIVRFETSGSSFDTVMAAYRMDATGHLLEVACDDDGGEFYGSRIQFVAFPNMIYHIAIDGLDGARGQIIVDWHFEPTPEKLPIILEPPRDQTARVGDPGVVFSVRVDEDLGPHLFQWFHNGSEIPEATQPDLPVPFPPNAQRPLSPDDVGFYYVEIRSIRAIERVVRSRRASLQFSVADADDQLLQGLAVDKFADALDRRAPPGPLRSIAGTAATPVLGYTGTQIFSTVGFSGEPGELSHCGFPGGASAWFAFIPAASGQLYLNTAGSTFNTVLAVYTGPGPTLASLTPVICDNDSGPGTTSSLDFSASGGTVYYIAVDGLNGVSGRAQLNYRLLVPMSLTSLVKTNETLCRFRVNGTPSYPVTIQRCAGFSIWTDVLTTNTSSLGYYDYRDTNATVPKRFYRALQVP